MNFGLSEEQRATIETARAFVENELYQHETEVDRTGAFSTDLIEEIQAAAISAAHQGNCGETVTFPHEMNRIIKRQSPHRRRTLRVQRRHEGLSCLR